MMCKGLKSHHISFLLEVFSLQYVIYFGRAFARYIRFGHDDRHFSLRNGILKTTVLLEEHAEAHVVNSQRSVASFYFHKPPTDHSKYGRS